VTQPRDDTLNQSENILSVILYDTFIDKTGISDCLDIFLESEDIPICTYFDLILVHLELSQNFRFSKKSGRHAREIRRWQHYHQSGTSKSVTGSGKVNTITNWWSLIRWEPGNRVWKR
jgi:hypothetical protein